jgi:anti-anti-sigma regulatory factor
MALRITIEKNAESIAIILEGRIAGPWAAEVDRTWSELAPSIGTKKVSIDLSNATYADADGIRVLHGIYSQTAAELKTSTPWTKYLAEEISRESYPNA